MTDGFRYKPRKQALHVDDEGLLEQITKLAAQLALTKGVVADILGVSRSTFFQFLKDNPEARDAWDAGRALGRLDFAKTGYIHARSDPATWRFLAKQERYLGMSDNPKVDKAVVTHTEAETKALRSREELEQRIRELMRKVPVEIDGEAEEVRSPANNAISRGRAIARRG